jgi:hypothetical protein
MNGGKGKRIGIGKEARIMKIGDMVKIRACDSIPEVVGGSAEIVDMQIQELDKYAVYPLWVRVTSGERKGKIYGFHYGEVEVLPEAHKVPETVVIGKEARIMKIGDMVKIKACDSIPEVVGGSAEIVDMQIQELDKYAVYPLWVRVTSGERKGKIYGFHYDEVEALPEAHEVPETMAAKEGRAERVKTKVVEQVEELLRGVATVEEIAEVERAINEVKGKVLAEPALGFWEGKTPCWEMFRCPEAVKNECPAFKYRTLPCWQIEGTYCKLRDYGQRGDATDICQVCRVYKRWGHGEPVEIKLRGRGFNTGVVVAK